MSSSHEALHRIGRYELPRSKVIEQYTDSNNLVHWQTGLQSVEHVSGEPGQPGCLTKLVFVQGGHRFELLETIIRNELPDEFEGFYSWGGGENALVNRFIELAPNQTRWESTCHYKMKKLFLKLMALLVPGKFKSQNQMYLDNFKAFCETGASVKEAQAT